jgi:hypothetical protein
VTTTPPEFYNRDDAFRNRWPWPPEGAYEAKAPEPIWSDLLGEVMTLDALRKVPKPQPLIDGVLNRSSLAWLAGAPGSYKTFLALDWALHVATGTGYMGRAVHRSPVLYLAGEGVSGLADRVDAWQEASKVTVTGTHWLPRAVPATAQEWYSLCEVVRHLNIGLVVLDTQARMAGGLDENSVPEMGKFVTALDDLRRANGACVLCVHHSSKAGSALRGSSAVQGAADTVVTLEVKDHVIGVHNLKQKDMAQFSDYWVRPVVTAKSCFLVETERPDTWDDKRRRNSYGESPP